MNKTPKHIGVILAAGIGSRLRPITNRLPKCMVEVAGKPILEYQIDAYRKAGIDEIIIITGYEGEVIENFCRHIKGIKIKIIENKDYETTNNMYSFYLAKDEIRSRPFILNNADLVISDVVVEMLINSKYESAIAVDTTIFTEESMKVSVSVNGEITDISKTMLEGDSFGCSIDFYKFSERDSVRFLRVVKSIIQNEKNLKDWTEVALQKAFKSGELKFYPVDIGGERWVEVDNYDDLYMADRIYSHFDRDLDQIDAVFLDLDGTLFVGGAVVPKADVAIDYLRKSEKKLFFLSNNSSKAKSDYVEKLQTFGIRMTVEEMILSSDGMIPYLKEKDIREIHVLGTDAFSRSLYEAGFDTKSDNPEYVIVGYDTELSYEKLIKACMFINRGVEILATHRDIFCPSEVGPIPDAGALLSMLHLTTGVSPTKVFGKPDVSIVAAKLRENRLKPERCLFVGDRLHTDILAAKNIGAKSLLVLTGETSRDMVQGNKIQPDYVVRSIGDIVRSLSFNN